MYIFTIEVSLLPNKRFTYIVLPMNWTHIIADLQSWGVTQPQIAAACGCAQATISDLATGKSSEPRYALGQSILALHKERSEKQEV